MKIYFDLVAGHAKMNALMTAMDLFDRGKKVLGTATVISFTLKEDEVVDEDKIKRTIAATKEALETTEPKNVVSFIGYRSPSINCTYIRPNTQSISDGKKWIRFKDLLEVLGYEVTTDEFVQVTSAKFIGNSINP